MIICTTKLHDLFVAIYKTLINGTQALLIIYMWVKILCTITINVQKPMGTDIIYGCSIFEVSTTALIYITSSLT